MRFVWTQDGSSTDIFGRDEDMGWGLVTGNDKRATVIACLIERTLFVAIHIYTDYFDINRN